MTIDPRCCGSGTCIVDAAGRCWCGQQWDGQAMCTPPRTASLGTAGHAGDAAGALPAPAQGDASSAPLPSAADSNGNQGGAERRAD